MTKAAARPAPDNSAKLDVPNFPYQEFISSEMRSDGLPGFWLCCERPFEEVAIEIWRDALSISMTVPSVLGDINRTLQSVPRKHSR
jgi:hypothetical protein